MGGREREHQRQEEVRERERRAEERREWLAWVARRPPWGIPDDLKRVLGMMKEDPEASAQTSTAREPNLDGPDDEIAEAEGEAEVEEMEEK